MKYGGVVVDIGAELKQILIQNGAALVGYGDLSGLPEKQTRGMCRGIAMAVKMTPEIMAGIKDAPTKEYYDEYRSLNKLLDRLCGIAADFLLERGFDARKQDTGSVAEDESALTTLLPHKTVVTRAGIGWIGDCALLVTEPYGPAVRLSSVLTNAPLETARPVNESRCGKCEVCRNVCPAHAVSGKNWSVELERQDFFDARSCQKVGISRAAKVGIHATMCGLCILSCPYARKYLHPDD